MAISLRESRRSYSYSTKKKSIDFAELHGYLHQEMNLRVLLGLKSGRRGKSLMRTNETIKKFDAVAMMRGIRDTLSQKYLEDPAKEEKDLAKIRTKYGMKMKEKV